MRSEGSRAEASRSASEMRRRAQALYRRPDLKMVDIRGNVETRLRKLIEQELDGLILAQAGLVSGERQSRSIVYRARLDRFRELTLYLIRDCCGGDPGLCGPLIKDLTEITDACC